MTIKEGLFILLGLAGAQLAAAASPAPAGNRISIEVAKDGAAWKATAASRPTSGEPGRGRQ